LTRKLVARVYGAKAKATEIPRVMFAAVAGSGTYTHSIALSRALTNTHKPASANANTKASAYAK
jgi:hypothetical protein